MQQTRHRFQNNTMTRSDPRPGLYLSMFCFRIWQLSFGILIGSLIALSPIAVCSASLKDISSYGSDALRTGQEQTKDVSPLASGERELKGGETQSYRISLIAGHFFHALVEQKDIDIAVALFAPDGEKLSQTDSPNDRWNTEPVLVVAAKTGDYRLDVISLDGKAPAGRYEIRIVAQREATEVDKGHVSAQRLFEESEKLRNQPQAAAKRQAIEKNQQASTLFETAGDTYRQALTLRQTGFAYLQLNEIRTAIGYLTQALALAQKLDERRLKATVYNFLGGAHDALGDLRIALAHYEQALVLARETGSKTTEGNALNNIGKIYNDLADRQKALEHYHQALLIFRTLGNKRAQGITLNNVGVAFNMVGEPQKATDYLKEALPLLQSASDKNAESYTLSNIGNALSRSGDYAGALSFYNQAQALQKVTGNRAQQAETLDLIGEAYLAQGQTDKALASHQEAIQIQRATGNIRREAISLNNVGRVYNLTGQAEKAAESFQQALTTFRAIGDLSNLAIALEGSARAELSRGNVEEAQKRVEEALSVIETVRTRSASQQLRASYLASMKRAYEFYIDLLMQRHAKDPSHGYDAEALRASERGRARSLTEMLVESNVDVRQGVAPALLERERDLTQTLNAKAQRKIQLLAQKGSKEELAALAREISALEDEYEQVKGAIRKSSPQYAALTQPEPATLKEIQQQLDPNTLFLEYSLGEERSYLWAVTPDSLKSYELPKRAKIKDAARQVYDLLTARSAVKLGETPLQKRERLAQADAQLRDAIKQLSDLVLWPAASELGLKRLVIVADDALQYVPFAALAAPGGRSAGKYKPLVLDHEIISVPSATALAVQRKNLAGRKPAPKVLAVIADPVFSLADDRFSAHLRSVKQIEAPADDSNTRIIEHLADDSSGRVAVKRLRFTRQEAEQILAVAPMANNLKALDFKANRATVTAKELGQYRYVHFATHGYLDSEREDLSAVVLSLVDEQGNQQDGFLRVHEIYNLNLSAELVVLSACQTGLGKDIKGEGFVGLTRGFMYAGARRLVVSLWNVNDRATAELMKRFYRGMLREKLTPAASLRRVQAEMSRDPRWNSPYYWAAFVLQGEWK